ncbi:MAG: FAD:protein FMN transferase [Eubacterium sp.]|nr:FAD:protein FMN transferase [Eubacterium sp.]
MKKRFGALLIALSLTLCGCMADEPPLRRTSLVMDTYFSVTDYGDYDYVAIDGVFDLVKECERLFSVTDPESELSAVNASDGKPVEVGERTYALLEGVLSFCGRTGGAIDPTVYPITAAWGFTRGEYTIPSDEEIAALLPLVSYRTLKIEGGAVTLPPGVRLDLGAAAKGYALEEAALLLKERRDTAIVLDLGGNLRTIGLKPDGSLWRTAVAAPDGSGENVCILELGECAVATSGNYERFFIGDDGERYCHILDPESGRPVDNGLSSVTVIGGSAFLCDALSTALFVMGGDRAADFWRESGDFEMILIGEDGSIRYTEGLRDRFRLTEAYRDAKTEVIGR